jgi:hypothetical protein
MANATPRRPLRRICGALRLGVLLACASACAGARGATLTEANREDLKAAFLFNFVKFTEWPAGALGGDGQPFIIGVLDEPELATALQSLLAGKRVMQRPIAVRSLDHPPDPTGCHVIFVGSRGAGEIEALLTSVRDQPVLSVGNGRKFAAAGGIIAFEDQDETLKFTASPEAAARAHLAISSQLLKVAIQRPGTGTRP